MVESTNKSIYWYDFETFGADPRRDRAAQFAGIRTDEKLQIIDEPQVFFCKPADDFLPSPQACLVTGITPQLAASKGVNEAEFVRRIQEQFSRPGTCVAGYNSIRFDDELTRQLLYRNFYDPYEREWKSGNSRWDIIDMMRLCAAVRPQGISWPVNEDGNVSFRLQALTAANDISHAAAHDALADVSATIEMAKRVQQHQPRVYEYLYRLRSKTRVEELLDTAHMKPVVHVSSMYPASLGCLALVAPVCRHPVDKNGIVVYDLRSDPSQWMYKDVTEIRRLLFTPRVELPDGEHRIPLKTLHVNRCPVVAPMSILEPEVCRRFDIDKDRCDLHWQALQGYGELRGKLSRVYDATDSDSESDPDFMIYSGGFFSDSDRKLMQVIRGSNPEQLASLDLPFKDKRLAEMLFRYRARNYPATLTAEEQQRWQQFRQSRLAGSANRQAFDREMQQAREEINDPRGRSVLEAVEEYTNTLAMDLTI